MIAPVSYQGGKTRIAALILDHIAPTGMFHDLCCGCGAVAIELVNRGYDPASITMLDAGPWGLFWEAVGIGTFDLDHFAHHCRCVPARDKIAEYMKTLAAQPANNDIYVYLLLQAAAFGGKAIWIRDNRWMNTSFRSYWQPTATSNCRSPVNPMMPMPDTLFERVKIVCEKMRGVHGWCMDIRNYRPLPGVVYIDPPYARTTAYGHTFDVVQYARGLQQPCYISEGRPLTDQAWLIASGRAKGGISGGRKIANDEWLSLVT